MVHESIAQAFNEKFVEAVSGLAAGGPFGKNAITPLASSSTEYMNQLTEDAKSKGAKGINAAQGGGHWDRSLYFPAVLFPVNSQMELWHAEQFGPVIPIAPFKDLSEPISWMSALSPPAESTSTHSVNVVPMFSLLPDDH